MSFKLSSTKLLPNGEPSVYITYIHTQTLSEQVRSSSLSLSTNLSRAALKRLLSVSSPARCNAFFAHYNRISRCKTLYLLYKAPRHLYTYALFINAGFAQNEKFLGEQRARALLCASVYYTLLNSYIQRDCFITVRRARDFIVFVLLYFLLYIYMSFDLRHKSELRGIF